MKAVKEIIQNIKFDNILNKTKLGIVFPYGYNKQRLLHNKQHISYIKFGFLPIFWLDKQCLDLKNNCYKLKDDERQYLINCGCDIKFLFSNRNNIPLKYCVFTDDLYTEFSTFFNKVEQHKELIEKEYNESY